MNLYLGDYRYALLLLLVPLLGGILVKFFQWRNKKRNLFADERFQAQFFKKPNMFSKKIPIFYLLGILFLIFSIIDILAGKEEIKSQQQMHNIIFLLDVSNSMNAEDITPDRLTNAKNIVIQTIKKIDKSRVGIVAFAGEARSIMPLTTDYTAIENYIKGIETSMIKVQGTDFLKAVQETSRKFRTVPKEARQVILLSDGEDNEGNEKAAINFAKKQNLRITTVGIGTEEGAPIPEYIYGQLMGYKTDFTGQAILTNRQTSALKNIANTTGGKYIDGNNLDNATNQILESLTTKNASSQITIQSENAIHYYQYFLVVALFFFSLIYLFNPKKDLNI